MKPANNIAPVKNPQDDKLVIACGAASITLYPCGKIELRGTSLIQIANTIELQAQRVDLCSQ